MFGRRRRRPVALTEDAAHLIAALVVSAARTDDPDLLAEIHDELAEALISALLLASGD